MIGDNDLVENNCLQFNGEYGFNGQGNNSTLTRNDIYDNNNAHAFDFPGSPANNQCGCSGAGKWWEGTNDATTDNYVHGDQGVGIWYDTDNVGALISGNYVSGEYGPGIQYEASYNAQITDNTLVGNAIGEGSDQDTPGFPDGAIYISESGGDSRVASNYSGQLLISGNVFTNNWGGVVLWENSDRYCSDGSDNACTLVDPSVYTESSCAANLSEKSPVDYYDNCRWKTQNVSVTNNTVHLQGRQRQLVMHPRQAVRVQRTVLQLRDEPVQPNGSHHVQTEQPLQRQHLCRAMELLRLEPEQRGQPRELGAVDRPSDRSVLDPERGVKRNMLERVRPGRRQHHHGVRRAFIRAWSRGGALYQGRFVALQSPTGYVGARMTFR